MDWTSSRRVAFRFSFVYLLLYCLPFPFGAFPGTEAIEVAYGRLHRQLVLWIAKALEVGIPVSESNGSGDRTFDYVAMFATLALAAMATLVWTALDQRRTHYRRLHDWLHTYVRYYLAAVMLSYGLSKVFPLQFPEPFPWRLVQPYGESSPMGLLWTFMGASAPYQMFTGSLEVIGGLLLLTRRTATAGALLVATVMANVVMLNLCYDVPVKLFSSHLAAMAVFLAAPDAAALVRVLLAKRVELTNRRGLARIALVVKLAFIAGVVFLQMKSHMDRWTERGAAPHELQGVYDVVDMVEDGRVVPPLLTERSRWRMVGLSRYGLRARRMDDTPFRWFTVGEPGERTFTVSTSWKGQPAGLVHWAKLADGIVVLVGVVDGHTVAVRLRPIDTSKMLLRTRGFRWINEAPYNR